MENPTPTIDSGNQIESCKSKEKLQKAIRIICLIIFIITIAFTILDAIERIISINLARLYYIECAEVGSLSQYSYRSAYKQYRLSEIIQFVLIMLLPLISSIIRRWKDNLKTAVIATVFNGVAIWFFFVCLPFYPPYYYGNAIYRIMNIVGYGMRIIYFAALCLAVIINGVKAFIGLRNYYKTRLPKIKVAKTQAVKVQTYTKELKMNNNDTTVNNQSNLIPGEPGVGLKFQKHINIYHAIYCILLWITIIAAAVIILVIDSDLWYLTFPVILLGVFLQLLFNTIREFFVTIGQIEINTTKTHISLKINPVTATKTDNKPE